MVAVPDLLKILAKAPSAADPRGMEQRYLSFAVFGKLLKRSLDGVDRQLLREAVAAGLKNQDGRARGAVGWTGLTAELRRDQAAAADDPRSDCHPGPSGIMFASGVRLAGIELLAKHQIREGMPLCLEVMEIG